MTASDHDAAVAGWLAQLREGVVTPWADYVASGSVGTPNRAPDPGPVRIGAAHLQLVRLVAERLGAGARLAQLADQIVATPAAGRGRVDIPLPVPGTSRPVGPPALDPVDVPAGEVLRVAVPVLAADLEPTVRGGEAGKGHHRGRFILQGNPGLTRPVRRALLAAGLREGGRRATHLVLVAPVEVAVLGIWDARISNGGTVRWRRLWRECAGAGEPMPGIDPSVALAGLSGRVRSDRVHVVIAGSSVEAAAHVSAALGVPVQVPRAPTWGQLDLARRINLFDAARLERDARAARTRLLLERGERATAEAFGVPGAPKGQRDWARETAVRLRDDLTDQVRAGGYAVHGDLQEVGRLVSTPRAIGTDMTLAAAIEALTAEVAR